VLELFVTQEMVLKLMARREKENRLTTVRTLMRELELSESAAAGQLRRLWRERLIETDCARRRGFRFRSEPGEILGELRFQLTRRGRDRLKWCGENRKREEEDW
jgi:hypothetical protein